MKGKEALEFMMYYHKNIDKMCDLTEAYNTIKADLDKLDELKE